ncbi:MAG: DMT family transporter, partial [Bacteroidaceae bacterium]|nr:DMT family transporter [Bacteroidaceae bacterium]
LGFGEFGIQPDMTGSKTLFAGIRFSMSGLIILSLAKATHRPFAVRKGSDLWYILLFALVNTTLHYAFFYFGLSHSEGARAAILNSMSVFLLVILACIFFESDRFTLGKALGCVLGFAGIMALNLGSEASGKFTFLGDGMIILNALCSAVAGLLTRGLSKRVDVFVGTGYSLFMGGILLVIPGLALGGTLPHITWQGLLILLSLICISTWGFALYNKLLSCNPVGKIAIFNSLIPVVGAVTSCLCLGEPFYWKYVWAGTLAATGIYIINRGKK